MLKRVLLYGVVSSFIALWWLIAFSHTHFQEVTTSPLSANSQPVAEPRLHLPPLSRSLIKQGLDGDVSVMMQLISQWDDEALALTSAGVSPIQRTAPDRYQKVQWMGRQSASKITSLKPRFLPQTCVAASFLLALVPPEQIVALPSIVRKQKQLYNRTLTKKIPLDIDRYDAERLFQAKPDIAFVAPYSHPATIQALHQQGVQTVNHGDILSFEDVLATLHTIGEKTQTESKTFLLATFMEAALMTIDNRLANQQMKSPTEKVLFLNHFQTYSLPSKTTMTGDFLQRLKIYPPENSPLLIHDHPNEWNCPIHLEQLIMHQPDRLILSMPKGDYPLPSELTNLTCAKNHQIFRVDHAVQQTPTQYCVLAYFDLYEALT